MKSPIPGFREGKKGQKFQGKKGLNPKVRNRIKYLKSLKERKEGKRKYAS